MDNNIIDITNFNKFGLISQGATPANKINLPNFDDPKVDEALGNKYVHLRRLFPIIDTAFNTWVVVNGILHSQEFLDTGVDSVDSSVSPGNYIKAIQGSDDKGKNSIWSKFANPNLYFDKQNDIVIVRLAAPSIDVSYGIGKPKITYRTVNVDESRNKAIKLLQRFIPSFEAPKRWIYQNGRVRPLIQNLQPGPIEPIEKYTKLNLDWTPNDKYSKDDKYNWQNVPLSVGYASRPPQGMKPGLGEFDYSGMLKTQWEIEPSSLRIITQADSRIPYSLHKEGTTGPLDGLNAIVSFEVVPLFYIYYPLEYAMWATSSSDFSKDFLPSNFAALINRFTSYAVSRAKRNVPEPRIGSYTRLRKLSANYSRSMAINNRPRTNSDDITILHTGRFCWCPPTDNIDHYTELLRSAYNADEKNITPNHQVPNLPNQLILVDWVFNRISYTNNEGNVNTIDLNGSTALDDVSIYRVLFMGMMNSRSQELIYKTENGGAGYLLQISKQLGIEFSANIPDDLKNSRTRSYIRDSYNLEMAWNFLYSVDKEMRFYQAIGGDIAGVNQKIEDAKNDFEKVSWSIVLVIVTEVRRFINEIWANWDKIEQPMSVKLVTLRPYLLIAVKYSSSHRHYLQAYTDAKLRNTATVVNRYSLKYAAPNLPGIKSLMPHQADIIAALSKNPHNVLMSAAPGSGKTLIQVIDIINKIKEGIGQRALVVCPGPLVKEMVKEINTYSQGKINPFVLRRGELERIMDVVGLKYLDLLKFLKSYPPNTVFICQYSFIGQRRSLTGEWATEIPYGDTTIQVWPIAEFLRTLDPQIVKADEAHKLAKLTTQRSKATLQVISHGVNKMLGSGTLLANSPSDIVGQMCQFNPAIFGNAQFFANTYGNGNVINTKLTPEGRERMVKDMLPYVQRIQKSRKNWAIYLPNMHENTYMATLNKKQSEFYEKILDQAMVSIQSSLIKAGIDPDIGDTDETEAKKMDIILSRHLARVEKFIVAPDSDPDYPNLTEDTPSGEDLISPHVKIADQIITRFLGNQAAAAADDFSDIMPDPNSKVLVFAHHRVAAAHFFKYTIHKDKAILYMANRDANIVRLYGESPPYGEQALIDFRNNPKIKILIAPSMSISEGFNLQAAGLMVNLEVPWSPSRFQQEVSRYMRPDFSDSRVRNDLYRAIVLCKKFDGDPALSVPKFGRLISKIIENAKVENSEDPAFKKIENKLADVSLLRMSLNMLKPPTKGGYSYDDLQGHFNVYSTYINWENQEFDSYREITKRIVEGHVGHPINSMEELAKEAMMPFDGSGELPNSKEVYTPFIPGADIHDRYKVGSMTPLAQIVNPVANEEDTEEEEDDDTENEVETEEEAEDAVEIKVGMPVITEFGPGRIAVILQRGGRTGSVRVDIPGLGGNNTVGRVTLKRSIVYTPTTPNGINRLEMLLKLSGKIGLPTILPGGKLPAIAVPDVGGIVAQTEKAPPRTIPGIIPTAPRPGGTNIHGIPVSETPTPKIPPRSIPIPGKITVTPPVSGRPIKTPTVTPNIINPTAPRPAPRPSTPSSNLPISDKTINVQVAVINGMAALMISTSNINTGPIVSSGKGWHVVPPFLAIHLHKAQSLRNIMNWLMARYVIPDKIANTILFQAKRFTTNRGNLLHASPVRFSDMQNFLNMEHRRIPIAVPPAKQTIMPYLMVFDEQIYLCFDILTHPPGFISNMRRIRTLFRDPVAGVGEVNVYPSTLFCFFTTKQNAWLELQQAAKLIPIGNLTDAKTELQQIQLNRVTTPQSVK